MSDKRSEMVERVARALCIAQGTNPDEPHESPAIECWWEAFAPDARAAIEAMRLPTIAMVRAGEMPGIPFNRQGSDGRLVENLAYSRMIDEALK